MKKIFYCIVILYGIIAISFTSCELFKIDNYDDPAETIKGEITDVVTGQRVLTDQDGQGIRIRMRELSWTGSKSLTNFDFNCMKEGNYVNTKVFKGHYNVRADGPFIPIVRLNQRGDTIADDSKYVDIKGVTVVNFQVQPFLKIEWVGEPVKNANNTITAKFKVTRAVSEADFRAKIEPMGGWNNNFLEVSDVRLWVSESAYVGRRENSGSTVFETFDGNNFVTKYGFGNTVTLTTGTIAKGRTVFIRASARIRYVTEGSSRYNYNEAKRVDM